MLNAIEELNKLIQRLEMIFQVQTHEVVQDLKKIKEMLVDTEGEETIITPTITEPIEEDKSELVKQYIEKYNKKPFAGRSVEVLKSKL